MWCVCVNVCLWWDTAAATAKSPQSCPTLCNPIDRSPPVSPVPGILKAKTLEWVAISFSSAWKWKMTVKSLSRVRLLATPWTAAHQAPPSMGFSRQEYWSGVPLPSLVMGYYSAMKRNEIVLFAATWHGWTWRTLCWSKVRQRQTLYDIIYMWNLKKTIS